MSQGPIKNILLEFQKNEITEHIIYNKLAEKLKGKNAGILKVIAKDELKHYNQWKQYSKTEVAPSRWIIFKYLFLARIFGITFMMKMMEKGEEQAESVYKGVLKKYPKANSILKDEQHHEDLLISMIEEEKINYIGSMVLGLNDALVELTGALAGLTFALQNTRLIGMAGLITGISAALSMSASEYLSQKSEKGESNPLKACFYTGLAYIVTVLFLVFPYFILKDYFHALGVTIFNGILVIIFFTFFVSVVKNIPFRRLFLEMLGISLGVAVISFGIGVIARSILKVEI